ncbi:hypothetical protein BCR37DRAFT_377199 [Protomyces lactucae-debilis]|uniref:F-box domain-containing protein n=1 Tax=Protomyces lactucae-debilis TaxID=2754530 RepID=A0A1Y2FNF6_PROLT|nr:uncharacterized protein BCR37DRAFT_377199 [Protomyces lactucae-debilis]ORY85522.1 hypothetical protein BCR37DRAFT_377199 [Protomyces lactucae-debilis]
MSRPRKRIDIQSLLSPASEGRRHGPIKYTKLANNAIVATREPLEEDQFCTAPESHELPYLPPEVLILIISHVPYADRVALTRVDRFWRLLTLQLSSKLKIMRDLTFCAPAPSSITAPEWLNYRTMTPSSRVLKLQRILAAMSSKLTYLNLLGTNLLSQDLVSWIYHIDLPELQMIKMPNGTDLYLALLRDLALRPKKWPKLTFFSVGFGSKLEIPEEAPELITIMRESRPDLRSNISRCTHCARLYYVDSRVKCVCCDRHICSQHFTRSSGNHCFLSRRVKCPFSKLKYHTVCHTLHTERGCATLNERGKHYPCYKPRLEEDYLAVVTTTEDEAEDAMHA